MECFTSFNFKTSNELAKRLAGLLSIFRRSCCFIKLREYPLLIPLLHFITILNKSDLNKSLVNGNYSGSVLILKRLVYFSIYRWSRVNINNKQPRYFRLVNIFTVQLTNLLKPHSGKETYQRCPIKRWILELIFYKFITEKYFFQIRLVKGITQPNILPLIFNRKRLCRIKIQYILLDSPLKEA